MNSKLSYAVKVLPAILMTLLSSNLSCKQQTKIVQPELGTKSVMILNLNNLQFKDLNKNGKLDFLAGRY